MAITCSSSSLNCFPSDFASSSLNLSYSKPNIIIRTHLLFCHRNQKPLNSSVSDKRRNRVSFFSGFSTKRVESFKEELFQAIKPLDRGAEASPEDQARVDQIARKLEAVNDIKEPLKSNLLNGKWELLYTTSQSLLQTKATANLVPLNSKRVAVKFDYFRIAGLIPIKSPGSGRGQLEITYLDEELRYEVQISS
ncbi:PAP fibrillin domain-containing protein [Citrus sinensis]|uniref:PAP fibrillin domain-containing protein n=1 Tax=Citrus sinensis TaxID=2711 RepID=A0ACB8KCA9_CITSI|nr:PAP fibrillin domain-containing protein [Citrus sinensis]